MNDAAPQKCNSGERSGRAVVYRAAGWVMPEKEKNDARGPSRREFMRKSLRGALAAGFVFSAADSQTLSITRNTLPLKGLSPVLSGFKIAFASDFHHGPLVPIEDIRNAVKMINGLFADVILLGGDYISKDTSYYDAVFAQLSRLSAPYGVYSVPGNHEYWTGVSTYTEKLARTPIVDLTNTGFTVRGGLYIAGLDDEWTGAPGADAAVSAAPAGVPRIVFTHNPCLADSLPPEYASLILAGHTHGWQVYVPMVTRWAMPIDTMRKYRAGYYRTPAGLMYVARGVGLYYMPLRFCASPEIVLFTLVPSPLGEG